MKNIDRLLKKARSNIVDNTEIELRAICERMTTEQLEELVDYNLSDERFRKIFASAGDLHLLEE